MKEKMVKRILSFLLTVALCIPMVLVNSMEAKAASEFTVCEEEAPDNSKLCEYCGETEQYYEWYTPYADYHVLLKYYGCCYKSIEDDSTKAEHDFSEGRCTECGYQEGGPICEHADCDRPTDGTESGTCSRCGSCVTYIISSAFI